MTASSTFTLPGSGEALVIERDPDTGATVGLAGGGRRYLSLTADGRRCLGDLAEIREVRADGGVRRTVTTSAGRWTEEYRWDEAGRLAHVDGVDVTRDEAGRITRCRSSREQHDWHYAYVDGAVVRVDNGAWCRHLTWDASRGRVVASRIDGERDELTYDTTGRRAGVATLPRSYHRDGAGRLWVITDGDRGDVVATYLWDRYRCLGRIDGRLGAPLAAAFSLDPTGTPVRVITARCTRRVPRDAFGEGLLAEAGAPGLFGGAIRDGVVHLPHRVLDPRTASYCSPDPFDGGPDDPRRADGFDGPLPTEVDRGGPYAVCRNDPIGHSDPTGAFTGGGGLAALIISDLTWSLQNNLLTFFGIDWVFNFTMSLITGFQLGDFGSTTGLGSSRLGSFGLRRDGFVAFLTGGRAFTTQHLVWSPAEEFELLHEARVIDPGGDFEPTLYGSVIGGRPSSGDPFLLTGMANPGGVDAGDRPKLWSRAGGEAVAVTSGAVVPKFPRGGFHLDNTNPDPDATGAILGVRGPQSCRLVELDVGERTGIGTLEATGTSTAALAGQAFSTGQLVLFSDSDDDLVFATVESAGRTSIAVDEDLTAIGPTGITAARVDPTPLSSESRDGEPAVPDAVDVAGTTVAYAAGDLLRIVASGGEVTAARADRLEAQVPLDRPVPPAVDPPFQVRATVPGATVDAVVTTTTEVQFAGPVPAQQAALVRSAAGGELAVLIVGSPSANERTVDADLSAIAAIGDTVTWVPLTSGAIIGARTAAAETTPVLTYTPQTAGAAPSGVSGGVVLRFEDGTDAAVRSVTGPPAYDSVVADRPLAGVGPFQVERRQLAAGVAPVAVTSVNVTVRLTVDPNDVVPRNDAGALQLQLLVGDPPTARLTPYTAADLAGDTLTTTQPADDAPSEPRPGQVVILDPGGADELVPVRAVRVAVTLDRTLDVAAEGITAVRLDLTGTAWPAARVGPRQVRVRPEARQTATTSVPTEFPRLRAGETVQVRWASPATIGRYRVGNVDGLTIDLESDVELPVGATDIRVQRLVPVDPETGTELIARDGEPVGGTTTDRIGWSVWQPDGLAEDTVIGVTTATGTTVPAVVTGVDQDVTIALTRTPAVTGPLDVAVPSVLATRYVSRYSQDGPRWELEGVDPADLTTDEASTLLVVPFLDTDRAVDGTLGGGTLLIPEDEQAEVDRHQSLVDHELRHTQQYSWFGPLWFNIFPLWALELGVELGTDVDLPTYGPFLDATIAPHSVNDTWHCTLGSSGDAAGFSNSSKVQVLRGGTFAETKVDSVDGAVLLLKADSGTTLPTGAVQVRRRNDSVAWDVIFGILRATTHGGLMNLGFGNTWGRLLWLIFKGVYGLHRARVGPGELHAAAVEGDGRRRLRLTTDAGRAALRGATVVIVRRGDDSVVRSASRDGSDEDVIVLDEGLPFDVTEVNVGPYSSHDPGSYFDWQDYYPAEVPDPTNGAEIVLQPLDGRTLEVAPRDRVEVIYRGTSFRTDVTGVSGTTVQLGQPVPIGAAGEQSLRIARVGAQDPMQSFDNTVLVEAGLGWLRWVLDPYGQIQARTQPENTFWDVVARVARYGLGTQSWSLMPAFGYVWYDRLFREAVSHRSFIEQNASENSGDLYSPLGRLYGSAKDEEGFAHKSMTVGDIARYWYWPTYRHAMQIVTRNLGAPGVHLVATDLRLLCNRTPSDRNDPANSDTAVADGARCVPDIFGLKEAPDPGVIVTGDAPDGVTPSALGLVPLSPTNQRSIGCYVAWTRTGDHRAVTTDGIRQGDAQDLHDRESRQTLFFDVTVNEVAVTIGGRSVAEGDTVTLVLTQAVRPVVTPDADRAYAVTVGQQQNGPVLRVEGNDQLVAQTTPGAGEVVEISRFYAQRAEGYSGGLDRFGIHLGGDVHVAVRQFTVDVVDQVPVRASADPTAAAATLTAGTAGFVLVPASIVTPLELVLFDGRSPAGTDPAVTITQTDVAGDNPAGQFIGSGGAVFEVLVADDPPLAGAVAMELAVGVGTPGGTTATLTCTTSVSPP